MGSKRCIGVARVREWQVRGYNVRRFEIGVRNSFVHLMSSVHQAAYDDEIVPFTAGDGMPLNLIHVRGEKPPHRGPVLLVHGAGVRANLFRPPESPNLVDVLLDHGYDVWLENWRASIDLPRSQWTLDEAALHDHPAAVAKVVEQTGRPTIKAIIHCQGSTSFAMSAVAGLVPQVDTIVSNAVSLHPVVPRWSRFKLGYAAPLVRLLTPYLNPHWGVEAPTLIAKAISLAVRCTHRECHNTVCRLVSFTYGSGFPALWRHENLSDATHDWLQEEFGDVPMTFFRQMNRCVRRGQLVALDPSRDLPREFASEAPQTTARFAFFAGDRSGCFLPESQIRSHAFVSQFRLNYHTLHRFPEYSHLDVLIGRRAAADVFPTILAELDRGPAA
jgi:hypothetical protein